MNSAKYGRWSCQREIPSNDALLQTRVKVASRSARTFALYIIVVLAIMDQNRNVDLPMCMKNLCVDRSAKLSRNKHHWNSFYKKKLACSTNSDR